MDLSSVLGDFGKVQKRVFLFCLLRSFTLVGFLYLVRFYSVVAEHWCAPTEPFANLTADEWKECCVPETVKGYSRCQHYEVGADGVVVNTSLTTCSSWNYGPTDGGYSFVNEWNLVCDRRWHVSMLYTLFSTGGLVTYGPSGYLSDKYGRRPCVIIGISVALVASLGSALSTSIFMFSVFQFFGGVGYAFIQHVSLTIFMELVGKKQRTYIPIFFSGFWGVGVMIFAGFSMFISSWRYFVIFFTLPAQLALLIVTLTILPESPRWLLSVKKYRRAETEIVKLAAINGITIIDKESVMTALKAKIEEKENKQVSNTGLGFLGSKRLLGYVAILFAIKMGKGFVGGGFNINLAHMGGHPKVNYIINGFTGIFSAGLYELARPILKFRRFVLVGCFGITGAAYMATTLVPDHFQWVKLAIAMTGNVLKKVANATMYILASELFPTHLRGKGIACYMICTRLGNILGSFSDLFVYKYGQNSIMLLFGGIYFMICVGVMFLPQTQNKFLADSVAEAKQITKTEVTSELLVINNDHLPIDGEHKIPNGDHKVPNGEMNAENCELLPSNGAIKA